MPQLLAAHAVRCGLMVDLSIAGNLEMTDDALSIDVTPTGFSPADALLNAIATESDRLLEGWFADRGLTLQHVLDALVATDQLHERRTLFGHARYSTSAPHRLQADKDADVSHPHTLASPTDAAVLALGHTAHLIGRMRQLSYRVELPEVPSEVFAQAGDHRWLVQAGVDYLGTRRSRYRFGDTVLD